MGRFQNATSMAFGAWVFLMALLLRVLTQPGVEDRSVFSFNFAKRNSHSRGGPRHRPPCAERAEERGVFELERVDSCRSADGRWRTKLNFGGGEPFDDLHGSAAFRTAPRMRKVWGVGSAWLGLRLWLRAEQVKAEWEERSTHAVSQEAEVTDAHEAFRKDVQ